MKIIQIVCLVMMFGGCVTNETWWQVQRTPKEGARNGVVGYSGTSRPEAEAQIDSFCGGGWDLRKESFNAYGAHFLHFECHESTAH